MSILGEQNRLKRERKDGSLRKAFDTVLKDMVKQEGNNSRYIRVVNWLRKLIGKQPLVVITDDTVLRGYLAIINAQNYTVSSDPVENFMKWRERVTEAFKIAENPGYVPESFKQTFLNDPAYYVTALVNKLSNPTAMERYGLTTVLEDNVEVNRIRDLRYVTTLNVIGSSRLQGVFEVEEETVLSEQDPVIFKLTVYRKTMTKIAVTIDIKRRVPTMELDDVGFTIVQTHAETSFLCQESNRVTNGVNIYVVVDEVRDGIYDFHFLESSKASPEVQYRTTIKAVNTN